MFVINTVTISGNLTRDPEVRTIPSGTSVCQLGVAVNERIKRGDNWEDRPSFIDVTAWGSLGDQIAKQCSKGQRIVVTGRLRQDQWQAQDGTKRSKVYIVAQAFVGGSGGSPNGGGGEERWIPADIPADTTGLPAPAASVQQSAQQAFNPDDPDDIPFT